MSIKYIEAIVGEFAWLVKRGHGSFIILNFGKPRLSIREPLDRGGAEYNIKKLNFRKITVCGDYVLWIQDCIWEIFINHDLIATSESNYESIDKALSLIDGQRLESIRYDQNLVVSEFNFDIGGRIKTSRCLGSDNTQWSIEGNKETLSFEYNGRILEE